MGRTVESETNRQEHGYNYIQTHNAYNHVFQTSMVLPGFSLFTEKPLLFQGDNLGPFLGRLGFLLGTFAIKGSKRDLLLRGTLHGSLKFLHVLGAEVLTDFLDYIFKNVL